MSGPVGGLAVTWWGHSSTTVELDGRRVATDPLLSRRLVHLVRTGPDPLPAATDADLVVVSHLHHDHLHVPSLLAFAADVPIVVPRGASAAVPALRGRCLVEVAPGDTVEVAGLHVEVRHAEHDGRRQVLSRRWAPALGFRLATGPTGVAGVRSCWYPGDTGPHAGLADVDPVDLALVPIGGWGPTLGEEHLDPQQAAAAVSRVGATWALAVHHGTFWPVALRTLLRANHQRLFVSPAGRFADALAGGPVLPLTPPFGERVELIGP